MILHTVWLYCCQTPEDNKSKKLAELTEYLLCNQTDSDLVWKLPPVWRSRRLLMGHCGLIKRHKSGGGQPSHYADKLSLSPEQSTQLLTHTHSHSLTHTDRPLSGTLDLYSFLEGKAASQCLNSVLYSRRGCLSFYSTDFWQVFWVRFR